MRRRNQFRVPRRVGLNVHVVTPNAVFRQQRDALFRQDSQRRADLHARQGIENQVDGVENALELVVRRRPAAPACHISERANALIVDLLRRLERRFRRDQWVRFDLS